MTAMIEQLVEQDRAARVRAWQRLQDSNKGARAAADEVLAARRAVVAERVRILQEVHRRMEYDSSMKAMAAERGKSVKDVKAESQVQVLFAEMRRFGGTGTDPYMTEDQKSKGEKMDYRKQANFGATKFIKP